MQHQGWQESEMDDPNRDDGAVIHRIGRHFAELRRARYRMRQRGIKISDGAGGLASEHADSSVLPL